MSTEASTAVKRTTTYLVDGVADLPMPYSKTAALRPTQVIITSLNGGDQAATVYWYRVLKSGEPGKNRSDIRIYAFSGIPAFVQDLLGAHAAKYGADR